MPITKNGSGTLIETPVIDKDQYERTGVIRDDMFAISDDLDKTKQIRFEASTQTANKSVTIAAGGNTADITITLPATSGTLVTSAGSAASFTTIQCSSGTSPVATGASDTLSLTAGSGITITGDSVTDTVTIAATASSSFTDNTFEVKDDGDATKILKFQLSGITTGNTRVLTPPNATDTLLGVATYAQVSNKDLAHDSVNFVSVANGYTRFSQTGTNGVATTLVVPSTATRSLTFPDATTSLVGNSSTSSDTALARFSGTTGNAIQNSVVTLSATQMAFPTTATLTVPHGTRSERFGDASSANATDALAVGNLATCNFNNSVSLGAASSSLGINGVNVGFDSHSYDNGTHLGRGATGATGISNTTSVGFGASGTNSSATVIGAASAGSAQHCSVLGAASTAAHTAALLLGFNTASTAANQCIMGGATRGINDVYIGEGVTVSGPAFTNVTLNSSGSVGSDAVAMDLTLASGKGTGNSTPTGVIFKSPTATTTGSAAQALAERARIDSKGLKLSSGFTRYRQTKAASYTAVAGDDIIGVTDNSSARTITLPAASDVQSGYMLVVKDEAGTAASANNIIISRAGSDTIDGATSVNITANYGVLRLYSDGASKWFSI